MRPGLRGGDHPAGAREADVSGFMVRALEATDAEIRFVTVPAPTGLPERLLDGTGPAAFWTTPGAPVHVGLGAAHTVVGTGVDRFRMIRDGAERLWGRVGVATHPETSPLAPRLFGGFSFLSGPPAAEWRSFGEALFLLPRLLYTLDPDGARLSVAITAEELDRAGPEVVVAEVEEVLSRLGVSPSPADPDPQPDPAHPDMVPLDDRDEWARAVSSIQSRIEAGRAEKIVAARARAVPLTGTPDLVGILRRLGQESATAARFAFRLGDGAFLGATPERLVGRTGREVQTEALAGSISADSPEREADLLASLKEGAEHEYVVRAIVEALAPLCESLEYPEEARVQRLRHVLHLQTPITGRLERAVHVLELVERLHPTPAVGGWPTREALAWIDREEMGSRGWYAAPVGWFDDRGDGEFGVALRSGLLHGGRAYLYAGAGIVRGSDADAEYRETDVKLRTMMDALGVRP